VTPDVYKTSVKRALLILALVGCAAQPRAEDRGPAAAPPRTIAARSLGATRFVHDASVTAVAFAPASDRVATGSADGTVRVFDLQGRELSRSAAHEDRVRFVGFLDDGTLVSAGADRRVRIGETVLTSARSPVVTVHGREVAWTPDERSVALVVSGVEVARFEEPRVQAIAISRDGDLIATVGTELVLRDSALLRVRARRGGLYNLGLLAPLAFLPDDRVALLRNDSLFALDMTHKRFEDLNGARERDASLLAPVAEWFAVADDGAIASAFFGDAGQSLVGVHVERAGRGTVDFAVPGDWAPLALSRDGRILAVANETGLELFDATTGRELEEALGHAQTVVSLVFSSDGRSLYSSGFEGRVFEWDLAAPAKPRLLGMTPDPRALAAGPDGPLAIFAPLDHAPRRERPGAIEACAVSPGGREVAWGTSYGTISVEDALTGVQLRHWIPSFGEDCSRLAFSQDGRDLVAIVSGKLRVFDIESGAERTPARTVACTGFASTDSGFVWVDEGVLRPAGVPLAAAGRFAVFSRRGDVVALGGGSSVPVCDARTGALVAILPGERREVTAIAFSPDGRTIATGDFAGAIRTWELAPGSR
jgi:WD40 repeat protein